jgi:hypothetical protein
MTHEEFYVWCPDCKAQGPVTSVSGDEALRRWHARGGFDGDRPRLIDLLGQFNAVDLTPPINDTDALAAWERASISVGLTGGIGHFGTTEIIPALAWLHEMIVLGAFADYRPEAAE